MGGAPASYVRIGVALDLMATGASKLHPPLNPTQVHLPCLTTSNPTHPPLRGSSPSARQERAQHLR